MSDEPEFEQVEWSYSAASLYRACPRRFFYRYANWPVSSPQSSTPHSSYSGQPPGTFLGIVVHDCIADQIDRWQQNKSLNLQTAQETATERLTQYATANAKSLSESDSSDETETDPDAIAESLIRTAHAHLASFFQVIWPSFSSHTYILHEEPRSFNVRGHPVTVRPDLCTRTEDGDFVITDWKTSTPDPFGEPTIQELVYALWAHQEYEPDLNRILVQLVHTKTGEFDRDRFDADDLDQLIDRIETDSKQWGTVSSQSDFPPDPEHEKCRQCPYCSRCEAGRNILQD
jgi:hypothetical protein